MSELFEWFKEAYVTLGAIGMMIGCASLPIMTAGYWWWSRQTKKTEKNIETNLEKLLNNYNKADKSI